jgi:hypothetical protein
VVGGVWEELFGTVVGGTHDGDVGVVAFGKRWGVDREKATGLKA